MSEFIVGKAGEGEWERIEEERFKLGEGGVCGRVKK